MTVRRSSPLTLVAALAMFLAVGACSVAPGATAGVAEPPADPAIAGCPTTQPAALAAGERRDVTITTDLGCDHLGRRG